MKTELLLFFTLLLSSCNNNIQQKGKNSEQRSIAFKKIAINLQNINDILNGNKPYNLLELKKISNELVENSKIPFEYMIDDGKEKNGKATQEIWNNSEKFNLEKIDFLNAVNDFNQQTKTENLNQIKTSFEKIENSCKSCHSKFRN